MSYKFMLPYVISTAALTMIPASSVKSQERTVDDGNDKDKIVNVTDSANVATRSAVPNLDLVALQEIDRETEQKMDSIFYAQITPFQVKPQGKSVIYVYRDGRRVVRHNGTRAWRNNNPGNLRYYDFAKRNGAIGEAGNFAVFPDEATGMQALYNLLQTDSYRNLTIANALKRYDRNNWRAYTRKLTRLTGLSAGTKLCNLKPHQLDDVAQTIRQLEGWVAGDEQQINTPQYAMVNATQQKAR